MKYILLLVAIAAITCIETLDSNVIKPIWNPPIYIPPVLIDWKKILSSLFQNDGEVSLQIAPFVVPLITTVAPIVWDVVKKIFKW